ncbi:MAG: hypothetical protein Phog2KO_47850 [Phototrophicaceae bacterium]
MTSTWLQRKRTEAGYTQAAFVEALNNAGIRKQQSIVSVWENTGQLPSTILGDAEQLMIIAKLLKVSVSDILNQYGYTDIHLSEDIRPQALSLARRISDLDPHQQDLIIGGINLLLMAVESSSEKITG